MLLGKTAWKAGEELRFLNEGSNRYLEQLDNLTFTRDRVRRFDYAPFPLLVSLIRGAKALVFPSLYEGFGLPVLEAMSLGTPVITSNTASIPEVAGDAALLVDPYDPRAIADAIKTISTDAALRETLSARGGRRRRCSRKSATASGCLRSMPGSCRRPRRSADPSGILGMPAPALKYLSSPRFSVMVFWWHSAHHAPSPNRAAQGWGRV